MSESTDDADPTITVCQGPPICSLIGKEADAAMRAGCPWCSHIIVHADGTRTVTEPARA